MKLYFLGDNGIQCAKNMDIESIEQLIPIVWEVLAAIRVEQYTLWGDSDVLPPRDIHPGLYAKVKPEILETRAFKWAQEHRSNDNYLYDFLSGASETYTRHYGKTHVLLKYIFDRGLAESPRFPPRSLLPAELYEWARHISVPIMPISAPGIASRELDTVWQHRLAYFMARKSQENLSFPFLRRTFERTSPAKPSWWSLLEVAEREGYITYDSPYIYTGSLSDDPGDQLAQGFTTQEVPSGRTVPERGPLYSSAHPEEPQDTRSGILFGGLRDLYTPVQ